MSDFECTDPRRRIRELLAIPDRDRTDAEWDELNELEIRTAPGNRESAGDRPVEKRANHAAQPRRAAAKNNGGQRGEARPQDARGEGRPAAKRQHRRPKRSGGQGGAGGAQGGGQGGEGGGTPGNPGNPGNT